MEGIELVPDHSLHLAPHPPGLVALLAATVRHPRPLVAAARRQGVRVRRVPGQALHLLLVISAHVQEDSFAGICMNAVAEEGF